MMNKIELLSSTQDGYSRFQELLAEFEVEQLIQPGAVGKWSIKDTVAHIVVHERRMIWWIHETLCRRPPATPQPYAMPDDELNELNEQIYQENLDRSLDDVLRDLEAAHDQAVRLVEGSSEEDLLNPDRFQLQGGEPLWEAVAANTFSHYEEHGKDLTAFKNLLSLLIVKSGHGSSDRSSKSQ